MGAQLFHTCGFFRAATGYEALDFNIIIVLASCNKSPSPIPPNLDRT
jgi:hypothetical protein